jgi:hypothetical protein
MGLLMAAHEVKESSNKKEGMEKFKRALTEVFVKKRDLKYSIKIEGYSSN